MQVTSMHKTKSICPICHKGIEAEYIQKGKNLYLEKRCDIHGGFSVIVLRDPVADWEYFKPIPPAETDCPFSCGLCQSHLQNTCCIEVEITSRCNLKCSYCFEDGISAEPSLDELRGLFKSFVAQGKPFLHLSGGEPTTRDDLVDIVRAAVDAGCTYIQLNTNGIKLVEDESLAKRLANAGLSFVFLQYDGTNDDIYMATRGEPLLETKLKAIENSAEHNLGVALACTLVPGVNTGDIGNMIDFAVSASPSVRGIHFQPVSYFGRYPKPPADDMRFTLPELVRAIEDQAGISQKCFLPSSCDHPLCGFHGDFVVMPDGLLPLTQADGSKSRSGEGICDIKDVEKNRMFVSRRWKREYLDGEPLDPHSIEGFLQRLKSHGLTITAMAFQDAYTLDVQRLRNCSLHIYKDGTVMPFCLRYILR